MVLRMGILNQKSKILPVPRFLGPVVDPLLFMTEIFQIFFSIIQSLEKTINKILDYAIVISFISNFDFHKFVVSLLSLIIHPQMQNG